MLLITDQHISRMMEGIGEKGMPYFYDFPLAFEIDRKAKRITRPINNLLETYQRLTGRTIPSMEKLKEMLEHCTDLWNERTYTETAIELHEKREEENYGIVRNRILPLYGVDISDTNTIHVFQDALKPCYSYKGYRLAADEFGFQKKLHKMVPLPLDERFELVGNKIVITQFHAEQRDRACSYFTKTADEQHRLKVAIKFLEPFRELERTIAPNLVRSKSYVRSMGVPFALRIVVISNDRKEILPNPEYVQRIKVENPKHDSLAVKILNQNKYENA